MWYNHQSYDIHVPYTCAINHCHVSSVTSLPTIAGSLTFPWTSYLKLEAQLIQNFMAPLWVHLLLGIGLCFQSYKQSRKWSDLWYSICLSLRHVHFKECVEVPFLSSHHICVDRLCGWLALVILQVIVGVSWWHYNQFAITKIILGAGVRQHL